MTYSYWDGTGHRKVITVKKGLTIGKFLEQVKQQLVSEFTEVRTTNCDDLMYIKEDLIIPHVSDAVQYINHTVMMTISL